MSGDPPSSIQGSLRRLCLCLNIQQKSKWWIYLFISVYSKRNNAFQLYQYWLKHRRHPLPSDSGTLCYTASIILNCFFTVIIIPRHQALFLKRQTKLTQNEMTLYWLNHYRIVSNRKVSTDYRKWLLPTLSISANRHWGHQIRIVQWTDFVECNAFSVELQATSARC